jgi:HAE1 family hydrophobic/amphiphilic exporter-1
MTLSDVSIKNPVFAVMLSAAMVVFGYLGYREMGISQFPEIDFPVVSITTNWEGAPPEIVDAEITDVIEDSISGVEGIDYVSSQSLQGVSVVTVFFHLHRDIDSAMVDVKNAVTAAADRLPKDASRDPCIISKINFNKFPVMWLSVHGTRPLDETSAFVDAHLKQQIQSIKGVGGVFYGGLRSRSMRIWLDRHKLQAFNLDAVDVLRAGQKEHVEQLGGILQARTREANLRLEGEATTPEKYAQIPIAVKDNQVIRVGDVAVVEDGLSDRRSLARFNRAPTVGVGVMRATGANVVEVCQEVKKKLPELRRMLPEGTAISISTDYSLFIIDDIEEVKHALFYGILLTALVTFFFLGSVGTTLNVCISIPTSLIGTFIAMRWFGFTVNFMTLLALSLSVGVVVDDAILVLENIYRRREHGEDRRTAALLGTREISFAAIAATFSIAAIFIPVAFLKGTIGLMFFQFAIAVTVAVLLSLVISLTITPMLCSLFLTVRQTGRPCPRAYRGLLGLLATAWTRSVWALDRFVIEPLLLRPVNWFLERLRDGYAWVLRHSLRHRWLVVPPSILLAAAALVFAWGLTVPLPGPVADATGSRNLQIKPVGRELVPSEDQNRCMVNVICPVGSGIDYVDEMLKRGERILVDLKDPETGEEVVATMFAAISIRPGQLISEGILFIRLIPAEERTMTQSDIIAQIRKEYAKVPGVRAVVLDLSTQGFTAVRGYPVDFAVQGPDWQKVTELSEEIQKAIAKERYQGPNGEVPLVTDVNSDYRPGMPEEQLVPDPEKAAALGVSIERIAFMLNVAVGGVRNGRFTDIDKRFDVRLRLLSPQRATASQIDDLYVKNNAGKLVPLRDLVRRSTASTLPVINRYNHVRKVQITANLGPDVAQGDAIARCREIAEEVRERMGLPTSYRIVQLGNAQAMDQTLNSLWWALALGFLVAYMILGVQFNSFVHPFTVLLAVPFGVTGALATLWVCGDRLNIMSMIGMVLLAGLVKKNSIILVDYTNQLRKEGLGLEEAVLTACPVRLRPILMTSLATIAAAVPLALGLGPGSETRGPLARSIIGGIVLSTLVTLIIVPVYYVLFDRFGAWVRNAARREKKERLPEPDEPVRLPGPHAPLPVPVPSMNGESPKPAERPRELEPVLKVQPETAT